jgi:hypothetical protein
MNTPGPDADYARRTSGDAAHHTDGDGWHDIVPFSDPTYEEAMLNLGESRPVPPPHQITSPYLILTTVQSAHSRRNGPKPNVGKGRGASTLAP